MNSDPFSSSDDELPLSTSSDSVPPASASTESQETFSAPPTSDDHEGNNEGDASASVPSSSPAQQEPRKPKREQPQRKPPHSTGNGSFPTPFKCCGDFCGVVLREELRGTSTHGSSSSPSLSSSGAGAYANKYLGTANVLPASTAIQMLFSQDDLQALGDDNLNCLLTSIHVSSRPDKAEPSNPAELLPKSASSSADLHVITYKSIALAKSNRDQFRRAASQRKTYEDKTSTSSNVACKRHLSRLMESTASQESRANSRVRVYGELDGVANYYRQVRVCGDCYAIYALLDMARSLMAAHRAAEPSEAKKQKQRFNKRREEWEQHVEREVQHKEQLYLRKRANKVAASEQSQSEDLTLVLPLQQSSRCVISAIPPRLPQGVHVHTRVPTRLARVLSHAVPVLTSIFGARINASGAQSVHGNNESNRISGSQSSLPRRLRIPCVQTLLQRSGLNAVESIGKVLRQRISNGNAKQKNRQSCIISMASGHGVFQECKQDMLLLIEQLVTGFHELHDAPIVPMKGSNALEGSIALTKKSENGHEVKFNSDNARRDEDDDAASRRYPNGKLSLGTQTSASRPTFEDAFITNVLSTMKEVAMSSEVTPSSSGRAGANNQLPAFSENTQWTHFQQEQMHQGMLVAKKKKALTAESHAPSSNIIYKIGDDSKIYPDTSAMSSSVQKPVPELKEYMAWRRAFRAFYARTLILRIKQQRCAIQLQRLWRAKLARKKCKGMKREDWAVRLVQRNWRGKLGRDSFRERMRRYPAAIDIQRIVRGFLAVRFVTRVREKLHNSAVSIQRVIRRYVAMRRVFHQRQRRNAAMCIQRVFRGHTGRKRFAQERAKFLYSKTQSQGISFGKQMLPEYKSYATKLQSDVALLAQTKRDVEARAEVLVKEICEFDEGIRLLESEMHTLSQVESESMAKNMDEQGKWQLREQKMRLDREFTQMLTQIALRKEKLSAMEDQLQQLNKERIAKEEELKTLERKLVVLLDEQLQELAKIKQKQQTRNQLLLDVLPPNASANSIGIGGGPGTPGFSLSSPSNGSSWTGASSVPTSLGTPASNAVSAFTQQQREEANSLMEPTEAMMKFGFMSMSMTYFSSMNMYKRAFADAAIDGALLLHLSDDDLQNTLGMEHRLHRKKILTSVQQLRESERVKMAKLYGSNAPDGLGGGGGTGSPQRASGSVASLAPAASPVPVPTMTVPSSATAPEPTGGATASASTVAGANLNVVVPFHEFCTLVRHGVVKQLKEVLANVPDKRFDSRSRNCCSPKGTNPNRQNKHDNTAGHYAVAYSFFDLGAWLLDPDKGGGRDDLLNDNGLTAYDGLELIKAIMETNEGVDGRWTRMLDGRRNGLVRMFDGTQTSHVDATEKDVSGERQQPVGTQEKEESAGSKAVPLPRVFVLMVLGMEVVLLLGVGLLLLTTTGVAGAATKSLLQHGAGFEGDANTVAAGVYTARAGVFVWGSLQFASCFFQRCKSQLIHALGICRLPASSALVVLGSITAHAAWITCISRLESAFSSSTRTTKMFSWEAVAVHLITNEQRVRVFEPLVFAPLREELFFRGLLFCALWNRLRSLRSSVIITNALFAAVHVVNARQLGSVYSASYLVYQVASAWLVGSLLSLRFAISGSLLECVLLHAVNNSFALAVSTQTDVDLRDPITLIAGASNGANLW
ncbi:Response receiver, partial [Globisporangium splendens]